MLLKNHYFLKEIDNVKIKVFANIYIYIFSTKFLEENKNDPQIV